MKFRLSILAAFTIAAAAFAAEATPFVAPPVPGYVARPQTQPDGGIIPVYYPILLDAETTTQPSTLPATIPATLPTTEPADQPAAGGWNPSRHVAGANPGNGVQWVNNNSTQVQGTTNQIYDGFCNGMVAQNVPAGLSLTDIVVADSYRVFDSDRFGGQAFYTNAVGPVWLTGFVAYQNGWQPGKPWTERQAYRHGRYQDVATGHEIINQSIFAASPGNGIETRSPAGTEVWNSVIAWNGIGLSVAGPTTCHHCVIYAGNYMIDSAPDAHGQFQPTDGTGNSAIAVFAAPLVLDDCWIIGAPHQFDAPIPGLKVYPQACVGLSTTWAGASTHPAWHPGVASVTATNCKIFGWPGKIAAGQFEQHPNPVSYDMHPIISSVLSGKISPHDAAVQMQTELRAAAVKAN